MRHLKTGVPILCCILLKELVPLLSHVCFVLAILLHFAEIFSLFFLQLLSDGT